MTSAVVTRSPEMNRATAISVMKSEAFLPESDAACVIDAVFEATGVYNPKSPPGAQINVAQLVAGCTVLDEETRRQQAEALAERGPVEDVGEFQELEVTNGALPEQFELTAETMPALSPGHSATGSVSIDGTTVDYVIVAPLGFKIGDPAPVLLAFPPGGQSLEQTQAVTARVYEAQAARRGWVVVSPAAPGSKWSEDAAELIPEMLRWINAWVTIEGGRPHLGGMSNGGISAFHVAAENPGAFRSLMAYPGFPNNSKDSEALPALSDIPVRLWVGGTDANWITPMENTANRLESAGGDVELFVMPGEGHVIASIQNGHAIFTELEAAR